MSLHQAGKPKSDGEKTRVRLECFLAQRCLPLLSVIDLLAEAGDGIQPTSKGILMFSRHHGKTRTLSLTVGLLALSFLLAALCLAQGNKKPETAGQKFKNIKILKDLPADQLIPVMHKFNDSLG